MPVPLLAALRFATAIFLIISAALIGAGSGYKCGRQPAVTKKFFSIDKWDDIAATNNVSPYSRIRGQYFPFLSCIIYALIAFFLCHTAARGKVLVSPICESTLQCFAFIVILAATALELYYVAGWYDETTCYVESWAGAAAFMIAATLVILYDVSHSYRSRHVTYIAI